MQTTVTSVVRVQQAVAVREAEVVVVDAGGEQVMSGDVGVAGDELVVTAVHARVQLRGFPRDGSSR